MRTKRAIASMALATLLAFVAVSWFSSLSGGVWKA
jgi:hypothetical protein